MLRSQEKWDRLKEICQHWHAVIQGGETMLDYKKLLSDRGFLVYVTQAYPSMKPYLKGFHLSLETWRGNCDAEGWKKRNNSPVDNDWKREQHALLRTSNFRHYARTQEICPHIARNHPPER